MIAFIFDFINEIFVHGCHPQKLIERRRIMTLGKEFLIERGFSHLFLAESKNLICIMQLYQIFLNWKQMDIKSRLKFFFTISILVRKALAVTL